MNLSCLVIVLNFKFYEKLVNFRLWKVNCEWIQGVTSHITDKSCVHTPVVTSYITQATCVSSQTIGAKLCLKWRGTYNKLFN